MTAHGRIRNEVSDGEEGMERELPRRWKKIRDEMRKTIGGKGTHKHHKSCSFCAWD
jgi:hypothetical protein